MKVKAVTTMKTPLGRWIIVLPAAKDWAWSGSRFVHHRGGVSLEAQVCNFETEKEALEYAQEHCLVREELPKEPEPPKRKPRRPELTPWRHAICDRCWEKREPGTEPIRLKDAEPVDCCFCNRRTQSGIFLRADSADMPCGGKH